MCCCKITFYNFSVVKCNLSFTWTVIGSKVNKLCQQMWTCRGLFAGINWTAIKSTKAFWNVQEWEIHRYSVRIGDINKYLAKKEDSTTNKEVSCPNSSSAVKKMIFASTFCRVGHWCEHLNLALHKVNTKPSTTESHRWYEMVYGLSEVATPTYQRNSLCNTTMCINPVKYLLSTFCMSGIWDTSVNIHPSIPAFPPRKRNSSKKLRSTLGDSKYHRKRKIVW